MLVHADSQPWWDSAVVYQIYPRSFQDSNGDGIGDLQGVIDRLDYVRDLGVDAIWLSPFFCSPQRDFGYDISDYCDVAAEYGTLATWDRLVEAAHARGLRLIIDGVYNHTSEEHPWFVESRSSRSNPKSDWYIWADGRAGGRKPPNNWRGATPIMPAWYRCEQRGQWYLASFHRCQPDLNWNQPEVRDAMFAAIKFWLDRGVDGLRLDMFPFIMKDPQLRNERYRL
ncbi:MAG TPA: alpha-amylase family glycosyl hydrolase, partial [Candidatus Acidoferrales bacterium]|nr:alpha-amylase family glycosyl hydrolase [Candidatus Acidoferrales bacterium]